MPLSTDLSGSRDSYGGGRAGAVAFAAVLLVIVGLFHAIQGVVAIASDDFYTKTDEYIFQFSLSTWGWTHLVLGALTLAAGAGLFFGMGVTTLGPTAFYAIGIAWAVMCVGITWWRYARPGAPKPG